MEYFPADIMAKGQPRPFYDAFGLEGPGEPAEGHGTNRGGQGMAWGEGGA